MANTFLSHRRMGEAEAVYRVTPDMHLSESNVKCVYVQTGWPETRYLHAEKVSSNVSDPKFADDPSVFEIDDRKGLHKESTTLLSKYWKECNDWNYSFFLEGDKCSLRQSHGML